MVGLGVFIASRVLRRPFDELMLPIAPHFSYWRKRYGIIREKDKEANNNQDGQERPPIPYFGYMIPPANPTGNTPPYPVSNPVAEPPTNPVINSARYSVKDLEKGEPAMPPPCYQP